MWKLPWEDSKTVSINGQPRVKPIVVANAKLIFENEILKKFAFFLSFF
jgi:hypothetical protein